jgi:Putative endonuclease segE, GIY-YIG domain
MSYDNPWVYNGKIFESEDIEDNFGFVYLIECTETNRSYIGRKYFWSFRTPKGKKRKVKSESDWKKYYGSCPELKEDLNKFGKNKFKRTILSLHRTIRKTNYEETRQLFLNNVLTESLDNGIPMYYNSNILSRYFRKDYYESNPIEVNVPKTD